MPNTLRDLRDIQFAQVETGLLRDPSISPQCKALYSLLITYGPSRIFPGQKTLADALGVHRRSVIRWLAELRTLGLIDWRQREGTSNEYDILGYKGGVTQVSQGVCHPRHRGCDTDVTRSRSTDPDPPKEESLPDDFADLFPERDTQPESPTGVLSDPAAKDPLGMAAACQKKQEEAPIKGWTTPYTGDAYYSVLQAFCTINERPLEQLRPVTQENWLRRFAIIAEGQNIRTVESMARAVLKLPEVCAWYIENRVWTSPFVQSFAEQVGMLAQQMAGGDHESEPVVISSEVWNSTPGVD